MSGGSFNYLETVDFDPPRRDDLEAMRVELVALKQDRESNGTPEEVTAVEQALRQTEALLKPPDVSAATRRIWHAIEWWRSSDWSFDKVVEALREKP